uniref:Phorbol-ester/DAG-type domain-containing protein n=1 Tax=Taenia asiatica TaxID=60517 RepID=A0A158R993_TAEAS
LAEEQERTERLKFDVREYEEENEDLCKRIQETSSKLRDKEAACERLLNDLDEKRAELAAQRKLLDEYIQQQHQQSQKSAAVATLENNHSNGFSATAGDSTAAVTAAKTELELKLREAVAWAEDCEAKLAYQEAYWNDQKLHWQHERSELQDRIREIVLERTSFLEGELRQERQRCTALEQRVMVWENQLVELISMADNEWAANDSLHDTVLHLMSDLQRIHNGSPDGSEYDDHRPVSGITSTALNSGSIGNAADWRQRKAGRISKMERSNLQLALNNEIRERELAQQRVRELEVQLEETAARLTDTSNKLLQTEKEKETLRDQLVQVTNEVRRSRMKTAEMDESTCLRAELLNGVHTSGHRTAESTTVRQTSKSSEKSISLGSGSGVSMSSHKLVPESFANPTKCLVCASLLLGQHWQGLRCQQCGFACHLQCRQAAASLPCSSSTIPSGMPSFDTDAAFGLGTVLEGPVRTPKGDIKRGWVQQYAFLCDMRLFIYDCTAVRRARTVYQPGTETSRDPQASTPTTDGGVGGTAVSPRSTGTLSITPPYNGGTQITYEMIYDIHGNSPACVIDLNASGFEVSRVSNTDVIHAKRSEVPHILKVNPDDYAGSTPVYLLFETQEECERWFGALQDGARLVSRDFARTLDSQCLQLSLLSDASFPLIKHILSACVLDEHRILVGTEDGLYIVDLRYKTYARVGEKKPIYQVEVLPEELQLIVVIQDKQRRLRLVLSGTIEGMNYEKIRVADPKSGVNLLAHGWSRGRTAYLLVAASSSIGGLWAYEVVREASRHRRLDLTPLPSASQIQALSLVRDGDCLAVGFESAFVIYNIWCHGTINVLLEPSCIDLDPSLLMFRQDRFAAQLAISVNLDEFLLVFENCGIYVDSQGQLTRQVYLFWPAKPLPRGFAYRQPFLYVFTEAGLFLFNVETSTWSASAAGSRRLRPLNTSDGHLCLMTHSSIQGLSKLVSSGSSGGANGGSNSGNVSGSGSGGLSSTANASLVYLPPPRKSMFASVQRRRTNTSLLTSSPLTRPLGVGGGMERQLELNNVTLLDASARARKSRRFSIFSRGPLFGPLLESVMSDHGTTSASSGGSGGGPAASGAATTSGSRLISAPSDFQHLAHQGPDVRIHFIDLAQSQRTTRCSTGNFSLAVEPSAGAKQSGMHSDSQASLNSSSSRQSTDQSLGEPEGSAEPISLSLPLSTSAPDGASAGDMGEEAITPSASSNTNSYHHQHHVPPTSSPLSPHRPTPPLESPCFRDKVLALFHTVSSFSCVHYTSSAGWNTNKKIENLNQLKRKYCETYDAKIQLDNILNIGGLGKVLRDLDNRLDKAKLKCEEADHIYRAYKQIKEKLEEEQFTFPVCLENLENQIKDSKMELEKLQRMHYDAVLAKDSALRELKFREEENKNDRRRRDIEISALRKVAEDKRNEADFSEKKLMTVSSSEDGHSDSPYGALGPKEEQLQKIKLYEDMYRKIRDVTGVEDVVKMVARFESQLEIMEHLNTLKTEDEIVIAELQDQFKNLKMELDDLKYTGESELERQAVAILLYSNMKLVKEYEEKVKEVTAERDALQQQLDDVSSLIVHCKAGMMHICEKLEDVDVSIPELDTAVPPAESTDAPIAKSAEEGSGGPEILRDSDRPDETIALISLCSEKVKGLIESMKRYDYDKKSNRIQETARRTILSTNEFFVATGVKIPEFNVRVPISQDLDNGSGEDNDSVLYEDDDDGALSRNAMKKQSQQIVEIRTKKRPAGDKTKKGR